MSREQRSPARCADTGTAEDSGAREPTPADGLMAWIDAALRGLDGPQAPTGGEQALAATDAAYARGFALGEALGRRFRHRCATGTRPQGMALLLEHIQRAPPDGADTQAQARRGLFAGFCWEIEMSLCERDSD